MNKLSREEQIKVLDWVYSTIGASFGKEEKDAPNLLNDLPRCGVFVTIHLEERLRGCIGFIEGKEKLNFTLKDAAYSAAFKDPRFSPLSEEEWEKSDLEISLLSPLKKIASPDELVMGEHGALLESGSSQGLFLPQVATEQGWDKDTFMNHLCAKARLPMDFWLNEKYTLYSFTAQVFGMKDNI